MIKRAICVLCLSVAVMPAALALSYGTPDGACAEVMAILAKGYAEGHEGRSPTTWADFESALNRSLDETYSYVLPTKRYAFLPQSLELPPPYEGELVLVMRRSFQDRSLYTTWYGLGEGLRERGRYIVYRTNGGSFRSAYVKEAYIQQAFKGSEHLLPTPDTEPERPYERRVRLWIFIKWTLVVLVSTLVLWRGWRWWRGVERPH